MLRALVIALLAANLGFFAWTAGWLDRLVGPSARSQREPERLQRQVRPETIRVIPPGAPLPASAPASSAMAASACLESAPMGASQASALAAALERMQPPLPPRSWVDDEVAGPAGGWLVYMGRYPGPEALARKEDELRRRHLAFEVVQAPAALAPGLSLGRYDDRAAAEEALAGLARQNVRTARIVPPAAAGPAHVVRFARAAPEVVMQVSTLKGDVFGTGFAPCATASTGEAAAGR